MGANNFIIGVDIEGESGTTRSVKVNEDRSLKVSDSDLLEASSNFASQNKNVLTSIFIKLNNIEALLKQIAE